MNPPKSVKERFEQYVVSHPQDSFTLEGMVSILGPENRPAVEKAFKEAQKRQGIFKPMLLKDSFKEGAYRFNPSYKTIEEMRNDAELVGKERVVSTGREWKPAQQVIQGDTSLSYRKRHLRSILERMAKSDAFGASDVEFLATEMPTLFPNQLSNPLKEETQIQTAR